MLVSIGFGYQGANENDSHLDWCKYPLEAPSTPFSLFFPRFSAPTPVQPSCPHPFRPSYPQFPVHNHFLMPLVLLFLWITMRRLNIMNLVCHEIGKTLGFWAFDGGGGGWVLASDIAVPSPALKKLK